MIYRACGSFFNKTFFHSSSLGFVAYSTTQQRMISHTVTELTRWHIVVKHYTDLQFVPSGPTLRQATCTFPSHDLHIVSSRHASQQLILNVRLR